jgi:hypothetical protein
MGTVQQNGTVTPGHAAIWVTDGVIQDGGALTASTRVLGSVRGVNFNTTTDQPILMPPSIVAFQLTGLIITNASLSMSAAVGGFYSAVLKGGSQIVANTQVYSGLTAPASLINATLTAFGSGTRFSSVNLPLVLNAANQYALAIYFALTTPQGAFSTADIYAVGLDLT